MSQQGGRTARARVGTSLPARAAVAGPGRGPPAGGGLPKLDELQQLRDEFRRRTGSDSDDEFEQFVNESRQRFQKMFADGGLQGLRLGQDDPFRALAGSALAGAGRGGDALAFSKARPALFKDQPSPPKSRAALKDSSALFSDRPSLLDDRLVRLKGRPGLLGGRQGKQADDGVLEDSLTLSPGSLSAAGQLIPSGGLGALSPAGALGTTSVQTFRSASSTSSTTVMSRGGRTGQSSVTRVSREQQLDQTSRDGAASVQQRQNHKVESATVTQRDGRTSVDARRAELSRQRAACARPDGSADLSEHVAASGGARRAVFERTDSGGSKQVSVDGADFSARARVGLRQAAGGGGSQLVPAGGAAPCGPLWRFFDAGQLIQPPGGRLSGTISLQASRSVFSSRDGALPRYTGDQIAYEDSFGGSESESEDDEPRRLEAPVASPVRRRRQLPWAHKPALPWRPSARPVSEAPSEAPSETPSEDPSEQDAELDDVTREEEAERARRERLRKIATELMTSERKYVQELHLIDQIFRCRVDEQNREQHMFDNDVATQMFANIKSIHQFHRDHLLPKLEARLKDWESDPRIGDIMKNSAPFLKMYTEYVSNFSNAMNLINAYYAKCPKFADIMRGIHEMDECVNLPLQHHMIVPVQRVPRYELLLKDYLKRLGDDSPDRPDTERALELVTLAATHSNDTMKRVDKFKQLLEIQENISGGPDLVSPTRELIKEGKICKISARSGDHQERYLFLFSDLLLLCSPRLINKRIISGPAYRLRAKFGIEGMQVLEGDNLETVNTFYISAGQKNVELYTQTANEKADWLEALCGVVTDFYERKASLKWEPHDAEHLGQRAPPLLSVDGVHRCMACDGPFSVMRRKHNCRACGLVVCGKCSSHKAALACEGGRQARVCDRCHQRLAARSGDSPALSPRRESVLDASYTRGKGLLDVAASEPCLHSGELQLRCRRSWVRRWFCLRANYALYMYQTADDRVALAATPVPGFTVTWAGAGKAEPGLPEKDRDRAFKLTLDRRSYTFLGDTKEEVGRWIAALQKASRAEALPDKKSAV